MHGYPTQDFLLYYVMQEQGFDKKNGLSFKETLYPGGAAAIDAMVAGTLDMCPGVGIVPLFVAAHAPGVPAGTLRLALYGPYSEQLGGSAIRLTFPFIFSAQAMSAVRDVLKLAQGRGLQPASCAARRSSPGSRRNCCAPAD